MGITPEQHLREAESHLEAARKHLREIEPTDPERERVRAALKALREEYEEMMRNE